MLHKRLTIITLFVIIGMGVFFSYSTQVFGSVISRHIQDKSNDIYYSTPLDVERNWYNPSLTVWPSPSLIRRTGLAYPLIDFTQPHNLIGESELGRLNEKMGHEMISVPPAAPAAQSGVIDYTTSGDPQVIYNVTTTGDSASPVCPSSNNCSLRGAINAAIAANDPNTVYIIKMPAGNHLISRGSLSISGANWKHLVIDGVGDHGSNVTTIDAGGNRGMFSISHSNVTLQDIRMSGSNGTAGFVISLNVSETQRLQLVRSTLEGNTSDYASSLASGILFPSGVIHIHQGKFYMLNSVIRSNNASGISTGNGLLGYDVHIEGSYIGNNKIYGLRFSQNQLSTSNQHRLTIQNSTLAYNEFGGLRARFITTLQLHHVTIAHNILNHTNSIAGLDVLYPRNSNVDVNYFLDHTIIAHNKDSTLRSRNCNIPVQVKSAGHNLLETGCFSSLQTSDLTVPSNQIGLGSLIGYPPYFPLETGSSALNAGAERFINDGNIAGCLPTDQRGVPRGVVDGCDIGAYDSQQGTFNLADVSTSLAVPAETLEHRGLQQIFTIKNQGDAILHDVTVTTTLPDNSRRLSGGTLSGNTVTFNVGRLARNSQTAVSLWVRANFSDTNVIESKPFIVEFTTGDGVSHSVTYNTVHTAQVLPTIPTGKINGPVGVYENEIFDYSIKAHSFSSIDFNNTVITTVLPVSTTFVSANNGGTYDSGTNIVTWSGLTIPSYGALTLNLQLQASNLPRGSSIQTNSNLYYARSGSYSWGLSASSRAYTYIHDRAVTTDLTITQSVLSIYTHRYNGRRLVNFLYEIQNGTHTYARPVKLDIKAPIGTECYNAWLTTGDNYWYHICSKNKVSFFLQSGWTLDPGEQDNRTQLVSLYDPASGLPLPTGSPIASCAADVQLTGSVPGVHATNDLIVGNVIADSAQVPIFSIETNQPDNTLTEGAEFTLDLTIKNQGQVDGTNVNVSMPLPNGVAYISGGTLVGSQVQWNLGTLGVNQSRTVEVLVRATSSTITLANPHYTLTADGGFNHGCGSPTPEIAVFPASISYIAPSVVGADAVYDSYLVIQNNSGDILNNVTITKTLPSNVTYVSGGSYISATKTINWNNLTIAAGDTVTIPLQMNAPTSITTTTIIRDDEPFNITIDGTTLSHAPVYILINPSGSIVVTGTKIITTVVLPPVILSSTRAPLASYAPLDVTFTNHSTGGDSYTWDFGDGTSLVTTAAISVSHTYTQPGVYTTTLMGSNGLMSPTLTSYVTAHPFDFIGSPQTGLIPLTVTFVSSATGSLWYQWDFGDNQQVTITSTQVTHVYTQSGSYTVSMVASNGFVTQSLTKSVYITATPERTWKLISSTAPNLVEHAMAYSPDLSHTVLFGGNATSWPYEASGWLLDSIGNFQEISGTTRTPSTRYGASLSYDSTNNVLVLFGGSDVNDISLNQTWIFDGTDWQAIAPATAPFSRTYHAVATDPLSGTNYLFGGNNGEIHFNDLWQYENGIWSTVTVSGTVPAARTLAAMTYDSQASLLYLYGGRGLTSTVLADFWQFNPRTTQWTLLDDGGGGPSARLAHSLTYDANTNEVILVGGLAADGDTVLGDSWHYQAGKGWSEPFLNQTISARAYHQTIYDWLMQRLVTVSSREVWHYE